MQLVRPDGSVAVDDPAAAVTPEVAFGHGLAALDLHERVPFDALGTWRLRYSLDGMMLADAPFTVVARASLVRCSVTPTDGRLAARTAFASAQVPGAR